MHHVGKLAWDHGIRPPCAILTYALVPCKLVVQFPLCEVMDSANWAGVVGVAVGINHVGLLSTINLCHVNGIVKGVYVRIFGYCVRIIGYY